MLRIIALYFFFVTLYAQNCPHQQAGLTRWSTWATQTTGQLVTIPVGTKILFDATTTPVFSGVYVDGELIFDEQNVELRSNFVVVRNGGKLQIGSPCCPFQSKATITLYTPSNTSQNFDGVGTKVVGNVGGTIIMYSALNGPTWTNLNVTANAGTRVLTLAENVNWNVGDKIIVTSTDFSMLQTEEHTVQSVVGNQVTIQNNLQYMHYGQITPEGVDERAEVAVLSRNIVVQSETNPPNGFGCHMMFLSGSHDVYLRGVEVIGGGQRGILGRYPIHFHMAGDFSDRAKVKDCSIHHSFQRCLVIHGTLGVEVERTVAHDTVGHCFFIEDGIETKNTLAYNLASYVRRANNFLLGSDSNAAAFWITHPDNTIIHNVAAGSEGMGFWYALPLNPEGPSAQIPGSDQIFPQRLPLSKFMHNKAHSITKDGLFIDSQGNEGGQYNPVTDPFASIFSYFSNPQLGLEAVFTDFTAYKISNRGAWLNGGQLTIDKSYFADCAIGVTFAARSFERVIKNSVFVGETANLGQVVQPYGRSIPKSNTPNYPIRGFEFYDGPVGTQDCKFYNFVKNQYRNASAISMFRLDQFSIAPTNWAKGVQIMDSSTAVFFGDYQHDGDKNVVIVDYDGSITGRPPANNRRTAVVSRDPFYVTNSCITRSDWEASICPDHFASLQIETTGVQSFANAQDHLVQVYRDDSNTPRKICGGTCPTTSGTNRDNFFTAIMLNREYYIQWNHSPPSSFELTLSHVDQVKPGGGMNYIIVGTCVPPGTTVTSTSYNFNNNPTAAAASLAALRTNPYTTNNKGTGLWYLDTTTNFLYAKIFPNEVRNSFNMKQSWPLGTVSFQLSIPGAYLNQVFTCTRPAFVQSPDPGLPSTAAVTPPAPWSKSAIVPRDDQGDPCITDTIGDTTPRSTFIVDTTPRTSQSSQSGQSSQIPTYDESSNLVTNTNTPITEESVANVIAATLISAILIALL